MSLRVPVGVRGCPRALDASFSPNPGRGPTRVTLFSAGALGSSTRVEASMFVLQGRRVATLFKGSLAAGRTQLDWGGRDDEGREIAGGVYLLRVSAADGRRFVTRVARTR